MAAVHKRLTNAAKGYSSRSYNIESGQGRPVDAPLSEQAPPDIGENKEADDNQGARDDAAQRGPRHGVGELGAEPGAAAQACREDHAQGQIELAVNYISGGRSNRHWKLKDLAQSDAGEDAKTHRKKNRHQQQRSARPRQRREKSCGCSDKDEYAVG